MEYALRLGRRALGTTAENPNVGCVIIKDDRLLGVGWTQAGGRPHAEVMALAMAGEGARGATAYVTLEPCAHQGRTSPCADALIAAGIARAVMAIEDPDPRVSGKGIAMLRAAGISADVGEGAEQARRDMAGFLTRITTRHPYVLLKMALSADGMIAARPGERTAITGAEANARVQLLRAQSDAILVGMETVVIDNPSLRCRLPGLESRSPKPFVLSKKRYLDSGSLLAERGAEFIRKASAEELELLGARGINRLMVEGGARTAASFLQADLVDEVQIFQSPVAFGQQGVRGLPEDALQAFKLRGQETLGADRLSIYERRQA